MWGLNASHLSSVDESEYVVYATSRKQCWPQGKGNSQICIFKANQFEIGTFKINKLLQLTSWFTYTIFLEDLIDLGMYYPINFQTHEHFQVINLTSIGSNWYNTSINGSYRHWIQGTLPWTQSRFLLLSQIQLWSGTEPK